MSPRDEALAFLEGEHDSAFIRLGEGLGEGEDDDDGEGSRLAGIWGGCWVNGKEGAYAW